MLRPYTFSYTKIVSTQSFVNHVMLDVIFRAPKIAAPAFSSALVLPKYQNIIDNINNEYILSPLSKVYQICKSLGREDLKLLKTAVHNNNQIDDLCKCKDGIQPVSYSDIQLINKDLALALKIFCDFLYDKSINRAPFYNIYGTVDAHYKNIVGRSSVCRCCGINKVLTKYHTHSSALDHYLPRKHYPFNSINFRNLIPICDICNSKYKLSEDTLYKTENKGKSNESKKRVKVFYPYSREAYDIQIDLKFNRPYNATIEPEHIDIDLNCVGFQEEVESWDRIFGIKENYKAECCTEEMQAYYEEQYIAEMNYGKSHDEYIGLLEKNKYGNSNFLKIPFLNALK